MELRLAIDVWLIVVALAAGALGGVLGARVFVRQREPGVSKEKLEAWLRGVDTGLGVVRKLKSGEQP